MFSETMTLISNAQDEFLCSLPSSPTAFWAQLNKMFLSLFLKWTICPSHLLFPTSTHTAMAGCPRGIWSHDWQKNQVNLCSEFITGPALMISWGSFQPEWSSEMKRGSPEPLASLSPGKKSLNKLSAITLQH